MRDIVVDQKKLEELIGRPVLLIDREKLPGEGEFLRSRRTWKTLEARKNVIMDMVKTDNRFRFIGESNASFLSSTMYASSTVYSKRRVEHRSFIPVSFSLFGAETLVQPNQKKLVHRAVILPPPFFLKNRGYWFLHSGLRVERNMPKLPSLNALHEGGHAISYFPKSDDKRKSTKTSYSGELYADAWANKTYLDLGGDAANVTNRIYSRALAAFLDMVPYRYWIAAGTEAARKGTVQPTYKNVIRSTEELQIRALSSVQNASTLDDVLSEEIPRKVRLIFGGQIWNDMDLKTKKIHSLYWVMTQKPHHRIFEGLAKALESPAITSDLTREIGELTLRAYEHFCPKSAKNIQYSPRRHHLMP